MTNFIVIGELQVKSSDEKNLLTWYEAMKGFSDGWRLPTKEELNLLCQQKDVVGGFANNYYWSSSEGISDDAWSQNFSSGYQYSSGSKGLTLPVRAVRDCKKK